MFVSIYRLAADEEEVGVCYRSVVDNVVAAAAWNVKNVESHERHPRIIPAPQCQQYDSKGIYISIYESD